MMRYLPLFLYMFLPFQLAFAQPEADVFSGPQPGEPLPNFPARVLFNDDPSAAPTDITSADPTLIVVVHKLTRPSVSFARALLDYAATRTDEGLQSTLVFLGEDATQLEQHVTRARHALPEKVQIALSPDGAEGPGSYGLNRNVTITILLADDRQVLFNSALIDPNIPVELPPVLQAICDVVGGVPPDVRTLAPGYGMRRSSQRDQREPADAASAAGSKEE